MPIPSEWVDSRRKRVFDLAGALLLGTAALPLIAIAALAIKLSSPGPVLFRHRRCGKNGAEFDLFKFRTMHHSRQHHGPALTCAEDPRVTPVGRLLRRWKVDELPQLFNVIRGDMSLVGPRPDSSEYIASLTAAQQSVLRLKPGITSIATLQFRHEEELLSTIPAEELASYYITQLLPQKIDIELHYAARASFFSDFAVLLQTPGAIFT